MNFLKDFAVNCNFFLTCLKLHGDCVRTAIFFYMSVSVVNF